MPRSHSSYSNGTSSHRCHPTPLPPPLLPRSVPNPLNLNIFSEVEESTEACPAGRSVPRVLWKHAARDLTLCTVSFLCRLPLYCVPVPGLSPWAIPLKQGRQEEQEGEPEIIAAAAGGLQKRQREDATGRAGGEGRDDMDCTVGAMRSDQIIRSGSVRSISSRIL